MPCQKSIGNRDFWRIGGTMGKHCTARARHSGFQTRVVKHHECLSDAGTKSLCNGLQIIATEVVWVCSKDRHCSSDCVALEVRVRKNLRSFDALRGLEDPKIGRRQLDGGDFFTHTFDPGIAPAQKKRDIGAQLEAEFFQLWQLQVQAPLTVQGQQASGGIG